MASKAINVRVPEEQLRLIDRAAKARGQNRSEFLLESCYEAAIATMSERPIIQLDDATYDAFVAALVAPAQPSERLKALMAQKAPWD